MSQLEEDYKNMKITNERLQEEMSVLQSQYESGAPASITSPGQQGKQPKNIIIVREKRDHMMFISQ